MLQRPFPGRWLPNVSLKFLQRFLLKQYKTLLFLTPQYCSEILAYRVEWWGRAGPINTVIVDKCSAWHFHTWSVWGSAASAGSARWAQDAQSHFSLKFRGRIIWKKKKTNIYLFTQLFNLFWAVALREAPKKKCCLVMEIFQKWGTPLPPLFRKLWNLWGNFFRLFFRMTIFSF